MLNGTSVDLCGDLVERLSRDDLSQAIAFGCFAELEKTGADFFDRVPPQYFLPEMAQQRDDEKRHHRLLLELSDSLLKQAMCGRVDRGEIPSLQRLAVSMTRGYLTKVRREFDRQIILLRKQSPENRREIRDEVYFTSRHAVTSLLLERRAFRGYQRLKRVSPNAEARSLAEQLFEEEKEHLAFAHRQLESVGKLEALLKHMTEFEEQEARKLLTGICDLMMRAAQ